MTRRLVISPLVWGDTLDAYDGLFATLGYEQRATNIASQGNLLATRKVAWAFDDNQVLSFAENRHWFLDNGFELVSEDLGAPTKWLAEVTPSTGPTPAKVRLAIDISSSTRRRIAQWIEALSSSSDENEMEVDFWYSMAEFTAPSDEESPNVTAGPVLPSFAGWATDPAAPTCLILGLGYERDQAIGAVEYIEPADVLAFDPSGSDPQYTGAVRAANEQLWNMKPNAPRRVPYDPTRAFKTFLTLERLVSGLVRRSRPVLLPFGPKVFTLVALLVARLHPACAVWRVSSGSAGRPIQRNASGQVVGLRARFMAAGGPLDDRYDADALTVGQIE